MSEFVFAIEDATFRNRLESLFDQENVGHREFLDGIEALREVVDRALDQRTPMTVLVGPSSLSGWYSVQLMLAGLNRRTADFVRVVLLTPHVDSSEVYRFLAFGANDVVDSSLDGSALRTAVATAMAGQERACSRYLVNGVDPAPSIIRTDIVYGDEVDRRLVLLLAAGYTDREIGQVLNYSHQVIRNRVSRLLLDSGLRNRTQLATRYMVERIMQNTNV